MAKKEYKKGIDKKNIFKDPVKLLYEILFWFGLVIILLSYYYSNFFVSIIGLSLIFLSIFFHELQYKAERAVKKPNIPWYIFFIVVGIFIIYFLYSLREKFFEKLKAPISESWPIYLLIALLLLDIITVILHFYKSGDKQKKPWFEVRVERTKLEKPKTEEIKFGQKSIKQEKRNRVYVLLFLMGLLITILAIIYQNWVTIGLGLILSVLSLIAYRMTRHARTSPSKSKIIEQTKAKVSPFDLIKSEKFENKEIDEKIRLLEEAEKEEMKDWLKEKDSLKELLKKKKEEGKTLSNLEKRKLKEERIKAKQELKRIKKEKKEQIKLKKLQEKLEKIEKASEELKKTEEELANGSLQVGKLGFKMDIQKLKDEIKKTEFYETDLDRLYYFLEKYNRLKFNDIALLFSISLEKVEEWAQILETRNLATIHYPAIGSPEIHKKIL